MSRLIIVTVISLKKIDWVNKSLSAEINILIGKRKYFLSENIWASNSRLEKRYQFISISLKIKLIQLHNRNWNGFITMEDTGFSF